MSYDKQLTRAELKKLNFDKLIEKYNNLCKAHKELKNNYNRLVEESIDVVFSEYNEDVELLARVLKNQGHILLKDNNYIRK